MSTTVNGLLAKRARRDRPTNSHVTAVSGSFASVSADSFRSRVFSLGAPGGDNQILTGSEPVPLEHRSYIEVDGSPGGFSIPLADPTSAESSVGMQKTFMMRDDPAGNTVTLIPSNGDTSELTFAGDNVTYLWNGSQWAIISEPGTIATGDAENVTPSVTGNLNSDSNDFGSGHVENGSSGGVLMSTGDASGIGSTGDLTLTSGDVTSGTSGDLILKTGEVTAGGTPGNVFIEGGSTPGPEPAGDVIIESGVSGGSGPGLVTIDGDTITFNGESIDVYKNRTTDGTGNVDSADGDFGSGHVQDGLSGDVLLSTGDVNGNGTPGNLTMRGGDVVGSSDGGDVTIRGGTSSLGSQGSVNIAGSTVLINGNPVDDFLPGNPGDINRTADTVDESSLPNDFGSGNTVNGFSGAVLLSTGNSTGTGSSGDLTIGSGSTENGDSGSLLLAAGNSSDGDGGNLNLAAGNVTDGAGDGGDVTVAAGTSDGNPSGTVFLEGSDILFNGVSYTQFGVTGDPNITPAVVGSNDSLDNRFGSGTVVDGRSGDVNITSGDATGTSGFSGDVLIRAGGGDPSIAGDVDIIAGAPAGNANGGRVTMRGHTSMFIVTSDTISSPNIQFLAGDASGSGNSGGSVILKGGDGTTGGLGGNIDINAGDAGIGADGGRVIIRGGAGSGGGNGGDVTVRGGQHDTNNNLDGNLFLWGSEIFINGVAFDNVNNGDPNVTDNQVSTSPSDPNTFGSGTVEDGTSGTADLITGDVSGDGDSGEITVRSGGVLGAGNSGPVTFRSGHATSGGGSGSTLVTTGPSSGSGRSGNVTVATGFSTGNKSGNINVITGIAQSNSSGDVRLETGPGVSASGTVTITTGSTSGGDSGDVVVTTANVTNSSAGNITMTGGDSNSGSAGNVVIRGGSRNSAGSGAAVTIQGGLNSGAGTDGNIVIGRSDSNGTIEMTGSVVLVNGQDILGILGDLNVTPNKTDGSDSDPNVFGSGNATGGGNSGNVTILTGTSDSGNRGNIFVQGGTTTMSSADGIIRFRENLASNENAFLAFPNELLSATGVNSFTVISNQRFGSDASGFFNIAAPGGTGNHSGEIAVFTLQVSAFTFSYSPLVIVTAGARNPSFTSEDGHDFVGKVSGYFTLSAGVYTCRVIGTDINRGNLNPNSARITYWIMGLQS